MPKTRRILLQILVRHRRFSIAQHEPNHLPHLQRESEGEKKFSILRVQAQFAVQRGREMALRTGMGRISKSRNRCVAARKLHKAPFPPSLCLRHYPSSIPVHCNVPATVSKTTFVLSQMEATVSLRAAYCTMTSTSGISSGSAHISHVPHETCRQGWQRTIEITCKGRPYIFT